MAYMINVPHAYTPEYPADETKSKPCKVPAIINVHDSYMAGSDKWDIAVDVEEAFQKICEMSWCHQSQITEWLPWVGRHDITRPKTPRNGMRPCAGGLSRKNRKLGVTNARNSPGIFQRDARREGCSHDLRTD